MTLTAQRSPNGAISISLDLKTGRFEVAVDPNGDYPIRRKFLLYGSAKRFFAKKKRKYGI